MHQLPGLLNPQWRKRRPLRPAKPSLFNVAALALAALASPAGAQTPSAQPEKPAVVVPNYWDTRLKPDKIDAGGLRVIRFLADDEYPPFHFTRPDGTLTGFSVDLARALCDQIKVACTIQARRWDTLLDSLADGRGDAIIAAMKITPAIRDRFQVTAPWHRSPARFVTRKDSPLPGLPPAALAEKTVGVVSGSAHAAFLRDLMPAVKRADHATLEEALNQLQKGAVDAVFADGVTLAVWLNGIEAKDCCAFSGGPYLQSRYFGEGVGIIVRKDEFALKQILDQALILAADKGIYAELYLKYFPIGFY